MMILIILLIQYVLSGFCKGKKNGFYCTDHIKFIWCYETDSGSALSCASGTDCKCGYSSFNPCGYSFQTMTDCTGTPGNGDETPNHSSEEQPTNDDYC
ncbi:chitinase Jessie 2, putative [Entamoeba histolytica HM-3:IMSS]|uniref:Chitinase jessie 2, putative n=2 Tax=Entamoeba histolytica TaxID=5759 RepID=M2RR53_ENTHI|nr:chitinase jessie 2, putative [Entamoeba histolytica KU27]EMS17596.1 chitinase Jessie 2, putative [Entamoeba histolytica HM-3:IMSS]